jgi:hypothetical protein
MNQHRPNPIPQFSLLQAELKRHRIDCYKVVKSKYHCCRHRPSSTQCLIYWRENQWLIAGDANTPAYQIARRILSQETPSSKVGQPVLWNACAGDWISLLDNTGNRVTSKVVDTFPSGFAINYRNRRCVVGYAVAIARQAVFVEEVVNEAADDFRIMLETHPPERSSAIRP